MQLYAPLTHFFNVLNKIYNRKKLVKLFSILISLFFVSVVDLLSISIIYPFFKIVENPEYGNNIPILNYIISHESDAKNIIFKSAFFFIIVSTLIFIFKQISNYLQARISNLIGHDITVAYFNSVVNKEYNFHQSNNSSEIISNISSKSLILVNNFISPLISFIINGLMLLVSFFAVLFFLDKEIIIITTLILIFYLILIKITSKSISRQSSVIDEYSNKIVKFCNETINSIKEIIILNKSVLFSNEFKGADLKIKVSNSKIQYLATMPRSVIEYIIILSIILFFSIVLIDDSINNIPLIILIGLFAQRVIPIAQQTYFNYSIMLGGYCIFSNMIKHIDDVNVKNNLDLTHNNDGSIDFKTIKFENINFSYSNNQIINDFSFIIKKGDIIGIIGPSGSGKSTLINIILGLISCEGNIKLNDEIFISNSNIKKYRALFSHVPQSVYLLDKSIRENLEFGFDFKKDEFYLNALKNVNMLDIINKPNLGLNGMIGENGSFISGGQKQRIGIARALCQQRQILVLDEGTSALDPVTELEVLKNLSTKQGDLTLILISHRTETLQNCNKLIKFSSNGNIKILSDKNEIQELINE